MKKLLLASTALVMSAGVAAADVSVGGDGRMGVIYDSSAATEWSFTNRIRISFSASGETDTGLSFGGSIRADNAAAGAAGTAGNVFISGAFGRLRMGDVDSADKMVNGFIGGVGLTGLSDANEVSYSADGGGLNGVVAAWNSYNAAQGILVSGISKPFATVPARVLYDYSMAGFTFALSHSQTGDDYSYAVGVGYEFDGFSFGLGYGEARNENVMTSTGPGAFNTALATTNQPGKVRDITVTAGYDFAGFDVKAMYQEKKYTVGNIPAGAPAAFIAPNDTHKSLGISGAYTFDMIGVSAYYIETKSDLLNVTADRYGIGASYDLGGGARLVGGVASIREIGLYDPVGTTFTTNRRTVADFGISLSF